MSDNEPTQSPDLSFFYTPADLYTMAETYGDQGRREYITARFTFDLIWPIVYMIFLATALSWVTTKAFDDKSLWSSANLLPVCGALFDYIENISTSLVMARFPSTTWGFDLLATVATPVKWLIISMSFAVLVFGLLKLLTKLLKK